ncbi:flagellar filament capping protein FliD [Paenibacillus sp. TC-CSREp1]|uniref:flagellar filament capping protein FliD n=1 Tax=Paenibacillus sp. TC-CSREp1 TaxID=3410089 RepID=UPI003CED92FA
MVTRVNGFSGMDIDSMVKSMMATKNLRLDRLNQDKQILQWQRESYRDLSSKLYDFRINKLTTKYGNSSALNANKSVVSGNTTAVKAEASASATTADMKVSVEKLASAKTLETSGLGQGVSRNTFLANLDGVEMSAMNESDLEAYLNKGFDITINGVSFKDKDGNSLFNGRTTISSFISTVNSNLQADVFASYDEATGKLSLASRSGGAAGDIKVETPSGKNSLIALFSKKTVIETNGAGSSVTDTQTLGDLQKLKDGKAPEPGAPMKGYSFIINGESFVFSETESISSVISKINGSTKAGVTAAFDQGKLTITANTGNEIKMGGNAYEFLSLFKGAVPFKEDANALTKVKDGSDAIVKVNDQSLDNIRTNTFTINGVQLTLQEETLKNGVDNPVIIKNQTDPDKALESIKGFIDDYNNLIKSLNSTIRETKYSDFKPLTEEQKKEMKESEILTWTDKAKSGLLKNNDIIKSVLSDMRSIISEKLGPLNSMGITTGLYSENGKLVIKDEAKLKTALSSNPQAVIDLFQGSDSAPNDGIFDKLADSASVAIQRISDRSGTNRFTTDVTSTFSEENPMGRQLKQYNSRIALMQRNIASTEDRYYKQFAAMEKAMSQMQSQSSSLLAQLGN